MATKLKAEYVSIGITVRIKDENAENGFVDLNDNIQLNLADEKHINEVLTDKPYAAEIIPILVEAMTKKYDPSAAKAKAFADKMKSFVSIGKEDTSKQ